MYLGINYAIFKILYRVIFGKKNIFTAMYDVSTSECRIPNMNPFSELLIGLRKHVPFPCHLDDRKLVLSNETHLFLNEKVKKRFKIKTLECCYRPFWRKSPRAGESDLRVEYSNVTHFFNTSIKVDDEFVQIECFLKGKKIYTDYHAFVPLRNPGSFKE